MQTLLRSSARETNISITTPLPPEFSACKEGSSSTRYSDSVTSTCIELLSPLGVGGLTLKWQGSSAVSKTTTLGTTPPLPSTTFWFSTKSSEKTQIGSLGAKTRWNPFRAKIWFSITETRAIILASWKSTTP